MERTGSRNEVNGMGTHQQCPSTDHSLPARSHAENLACLSSCYLQTHYRSNGSFSSHFPNGETEANRNGGFKVTYLERGGSRFPSTSDPEMESCALRPSAAMAVKEEGA